MKPNDSNKNKNTGDNESAIEKITEKTKEAFGTGDDRENEGHIVDKPFQDTPDEGAEDVPTEDKVIKDHKTGEETFIKNENKR